MPQIQPSKPPLQPKQAVIISTIAIIGTPIGCILFMVLFHTPIIPTILWSAFILYLALGVSWSFLSWETRNAAIRGNNAFVIFAVILLGVLLIFSKDYEPFPTWAIIVLIISGVCGYSVIGICAVRNFLKWLRGNFKNN
jgi:hypothetical protein